MNKTGWGTPWANALDFVTIFFSGITDKEVQDKVNKLAKNLGARETNDIKEATHVVAEPNTDIKLIVIIKLNIVK